MDNRYWACFTEFLDGGVFIRNPTYNQQRKLLRFKGEDECCDLKKNATKEALLKFVKKIFDEMDCDEEDLLQFSEMVDDWDNHPDQVIMLYCSRGAFDMTWNNGIN